ncbi:MAG: ABC transporter permease [Clostridia bacterium]
MQSKNNAINKKQFDFSKYMVYIILVFVLLLFALWLGTDFFSISNILNITRQTAMISIMAVAMTFVIATGNIDLSIGSIVAIASLVCAVTINATDSIPLALVVTLGFGALVGALNGVLTTTLKIPSFLVTLGMLSVLKGAAMLLSNTKAIPILNNKFNNIFGFMDIGGKVPVLLIWTIVALAIGYFALNYLPYGRKVLATGGNIVSALYSGINVNKTIIWVMTFSGFAASFAAMLYSGRMQTARYTFGEGVELDVIAAVVLGGTAMSGGTGTVVGAVVGSFLLGIINNGLILAGLTVAQQMIVKGLLIIVAVALNNIGSMRKSKA